MTHSQFNIVSPRFKANPFPLLANLRASQPVYRTALPDKTPVWLLTRYEDVATLLKDERFVKDKRKVMTTEQLRKMPWAENGLRTGAACALKAKKSCYERNLVAVIPPLY
jgi:cytochrome P450